MPRNRKVGIKDVAHAAHVSNSTVSHVLSGTAPISIEVRARVLNAARQVGYLAERKVKATIATLRTVLLAVNDDALPHNDINMYSWTMMKALSSECERRGVRLVAHSSDGNLDPQSVIAAARQTDGILIVNDDNRALLDGIAEAGLPAVLINAEDQDMRIDSVSPGNRFAAQLATKWLISKGHRKILHLTWDGRTTIRRREDGFHDAFRAAGLPEDDAVVLHAGGYEPRFGEEAMGRWISENHGMAGVTALFCAADNLAMGAMRALSTAGLSVPHDISVMGFDGIVLGELMTPALSTIHVPLEQMGPAALSLLEQRVVAADTARAANRLELGCSIIERSSVAARN